MNKFRKIIVVAIFFTISSLNILATSNLSDYRALLVGDDKGNITKVNNGNTIRPLASITKVMTSILTLEKVKRGEIKMDDKVVISPFAASIPYGIKLVAGNTYTVRDLLKATIIRSSNNAAYALGEYVGGTNEMFVRLMNEKARELGLNSLKFCSAHGLPPSYTGSCMDQGNSQDLYKMAMYAVTFPQYLEISKYANGGMSDGTALKSTNALLDKVQGVDGLKTGYHNAAGSNIILTAKRGGRRVIVVILGSQRAANRNAIGTEEINSYYNGGYKIVQSKVDVPKPSRKNSDEKNSKNKENISRKNTEVKAVYKDELIGTISIGNVKYGLYSADNINLQGGRVEKPNLNYTISLQNKITKRHLKKVVGTFIATHGNEVYTGALVLGELK